MPIKTCPICDYHTTHTSCPVCAWELTIVVNGRPMHISRHGRIMRRGMPKPQSVSLNPRENVKALTPILVRQCHAGA